MQRYRTGILGATGLVGQRLVQRLEGHPWFELVAVAASERSEGRPYRDAVRWALSTSLPAGVASMPLKPARPAELGDCDVVFSALDAAVARELEPAFAAAGCAVVSNSSAFRQDPAVPWDPLESTCRHASLSIL